MFDAACVAQLHTLDLRNADLRRRRVARRAGAASTLCGVHMGLRLRCGLRMKPRTAAARLRRPCRRTRWVCSCSWCAPPFHPLSTPAPAAPAFLRPPLTCAWLAGVVGISIGAFMAAHCTRPGWRQRRQQRRTGSVG